MTYGDLIPKWKKDIIQTSLSFEQEEHLLTQGISKMVRDTSYEQVINDPHTDTQRDIIESIIDEYPEGVTDEWISIESGIPRSTVNARRNEISGIYVVGIVRIVEEDGSTRINTLWGKL